MHAKINHIVRLTSGVALETAGCASSISTPTLTGLQVRLALVEPYPLHDDSALPCHNVAVQEFDAAGAVSRFHRCDPDGAEPPPDTAEVVAAGCCGATATLRSSGRPRRLLSTGWWPATVPARDELPGECRRRLGARRVRGHGRSCGWCVP